MKSLLFKHPAVAEPLSSAPSKLKLFKLQTRKMSSFAWRGLLSVVAIASILSIAPKAMALRFGDTGTEVSRLQSALGIRADGIFGSQTRSAVISYQERCGLLVDGIAGTQTLSTLASGSCLALRPGEGGSGGGDIGYGPYVVVVPGSSSDRLAAVNRVAPGAAYDEAGRGSFINAGRFSSRSNAESLSDRLKDVGLPARVDFRP
ncbi:MAG: peptidoglycan-binding protein [Drouetiella hepatica Uher 2000/2452]|jgi:hypothetical protein|uniref:Peptidoglycan-binding protein n=1 Tax=Drouetiella hepatica Uher 2000/2452 TaxID=904376 RepID=A0A951QEU6_9CYAN|nr:peptidoglycan-binding protein [Drouetiella hepatica Uher 2000/2452]